MYLCVGLFITISTELLDLFLIWHFYYFKCYAYYYGYPCMNRSPFFFTMSVKTSCTPKKTKLKKNVLFCKIQTFAPDEGETAI